MQAIHPWFLAAAALTLAIGSAAEGSVVSSLAAGSPVSVPSGTPARYQYSYKVYLTPQNSFGDGDVFTFYDFAGYTGNASITINPLADVGGSFTISSASLGVNPSAEGRSVSVTDSATVPNISFTYHGASMVNNGDPEIDPMIRIATVMLESYYPTGAIAAKLPFAASDYNMTTANGEVNTYTVLGPKATVNSELVPAPAAVWAGLGMLGGLGAWATRRRMAR